MNEMQIGKIGGFLTKMKDVITKYKNITLDDLEDLKK